MSLLEGQERAVLEWSLVPRSPSEEEETVPTHRDEECSLRGARREGKESLAALRLQESPLLLWE